MTSNPLILSGPYTHDNLTIFLFHGPDRPIPIWSARIAPNKSKPHVASLLLDKIAIEHLIRVAEPPAKNERIDVHSSDIRC